jgi:hypothetical protein
MSQWAEEMQGEAIRRYRAAANQRAEFDAQYYGGWGQPRQQHDARQRAAVCRVTCRNTQITELREIQGVWQ